MIWMGWRPTPSKVAKDSGAAFEGAGGAVGYGGEGVAQQFAFFGHTGNNITTMESHANPLQGGILSVVTS